MHTAAFQALGIAAEYRRFDVMPEDLKQFCFEAREKHYAGFSVTAPHKETIIPFLDGLDPVATEIGAVNTVVNQDGTLIGYNTDWIGVQKALEEAGAVLKDQKVLVLGAGGAARAVVYGCIKAGADVLIFNRTEEKALELAEKWHARVGTLDDARSVSIIINTTSAHEALLTKKDFNKGQIVMDCTYDPPETEFLRIAKEASAKALNGLAMLLYQGAAQCELWTEKKAPLKVMQKTLLGFSS